MTQPYKWGLIKVNVKTTAHRPHQIYYATTVLHKSGTECGSYNIRMHLLKQAHFLHKVFVFPQWMLLKLHCP